MTDPVETPPTADQPAQPPEEPYPDMRTEVGKRPALHTGLPSHRRVGYNVSPTAYEYDLYDWLWRIAFCVLGLIVGFLIGHYI
jgi:hypothetical protein